MSTYKSDGIRYVEAFTFWLLIKICTTASKFYTFLSTSISIYRKKWKSALCMECGAELAKVLPPTSPPAGGQKVLPAGGRLYLYLCRGKVFRVAGRGWQGRRVAHARRVARSADATLLPRTLLRSQPSRASSSKLGIRRVVLRSRYLDHHNYIQ